MLPVTTKGKQCLRAAHHESNLAFGREKNLQVEPEMSLLCAFTGTEGFDWRSAPCLSMVWYDTEIATA